LRKHLFHPYV